MKAYVVHIIVGVLLGHACFVHSQSSRFIKQPILLPTVFVLGDYEEQYEEIMPKYTSLLEACNNDMQLAFGKLMSMMQEMQAYAAMTGYDLKDINAWMHFFWKKDGSIDHIGFYLKPNSRNVSPEGLKKFLAGFAGQYKFPLTASTGFNHYSTFSFPVVRQAAVAKQEGGGRK